MDSFATNPTDRLPGELRSVLQEVLLPPLNSVELGRTPLGDYLFRVSSGGVQAAELFQENSKIYPAQQANRPLDTDAAERIREWYYETAYRPNAGEFDDDAARAAAVRVPVTDLAPPLAALCTALTTEHADLLYAVDAFLISGGTSHRLMPRNPWLWLDRRLDDADWAELGGNVYGAAEPPAALLALAIVPWRYMLLQGPRGYRRTLVDLGRLVERCEQHGGRHGLRVTTTLDFQDYEVDRILTFDGVERSVHAICLLNPNGAGS